jgi:hypothetical protein
VEDGIDSPRELAALYDEPEMTGQAEKYATAAPIYTNSRNDYDQKKRKKKNRNKIANWPPNLEAKRTRTQAHVGNRWKK